MFFTLKIIFLIIIRLCIRLNSFVENAMWPRIPSLWRTPWIKHASWTHPWHPCPSFHSINLNILCEWQQGHFNKWREKITFQGLQKNSIRCSMTFFPFKNNWLFWKSFWFRFEKWIRFVLHLITNSCFYYFPKPQKQECHPFPL